MLELLMIDVALCAALIMVAVVVMVRHWRRSSDQPSMPVREWRGAVAELAGQVAAQRDIAVVPGFSDATVESEQAAESQVIGVVNLEPGPDGPGSEPDGQHAAAGAVTSNEQIASYYDEADRRMSDYLAALGWTGQPGMHDPG